MADPVRKANESFRRAETVLDLLAVQITDQDCFSCGTNGAVRAAEVLQ